MPTLGQDLLKLKRFKDEEAALKARADKAAAKRKQWEAHCFERMDAEEADSHKTRGILFARSGKQYAQIQDRASFIEWAKVHEPDLVKEAERSAELNALVRQRLDDNEPLPPGVGFYVRENVSVRKA